MLQIAVSSDDAPMMGLTIAVLIRAKSAVQAVVIIMSLGFIAFVTVLHIVGELQDQYAVSLQLLAVDIRKFPSCRQSPWKVMQQRCDALE